MKLRNFLKEKVKTEDAAVLLRLVFHDGGTKDAISGMYGLNGSIRFPEEYNREENSGLERGVRIIEELQYNFHKETNCSVSFADCLAFAGAIAIEKAGGPSIFLETGRKDSDSPDPGSMLPTDNLSFNSLFTVFQRMGFTVRDLVALSGAHTLGFANRVAFTSNPFVFDNSYYQRVLQGDSENYILLQTDKALKENPEAFELVKQYSFDKTAFFRDFSESYRKLCGEKSTKEDVHRIYE
jgi:adenylate cyclase